MRHNKRNLSSISLLSKWPKHPKAEAAKARAQEAASSPPAFSCVHTQEPGSEAEVELRLHIPIRGVSATAPNTHPYSGIFNWNLFVIIVKSNFIEIKKQANISFTLAMLLCHITH